MARRVERVTRRKRSVRAAGGKAWGLHRLVRRGLLIPPAIVVRPGPSETPDESSEELRALLAEHVTDDGSYAVRSSATVEDGREQSHAGQFMTRLDVVGLDAVVEAVIEVSAGEHPVVVQSMVEAQVGGVVFSRHPMTGLSDVVLEAVVGSAASMLAGQETPQRWVWRWGSFVESPAEPIAPSWLVREVVESAAALDWSEGPVDLEWAWDGTHLWWLQMRPITTTDVPVYSNRIAKEVLPGLIHPLVWSVNVPVVNGAWIDLFTSLVGGTHLRPDDLAARIGARAYFDMRAVGDVFETVGMPRDLLEVLMGLEGGDRRPSFRPGVGVGRHLPRMMTQGARFALYEHSLVRELSEIEARAATDFVRPLHSSTDEDLVTEIEEWAALTRRLARANIVAPLLMNFHGGRYRRALEKLGHDPLLANPTAGHPEAGRFDPAPALAALARSYRSLSDTDQARLDAGDTEVLAGLDPFLARFGHLSSSGNDFAVPRWRDDPTIVVDMVRAAAPDESGSEVSAPDASGRRLSTLRNRAARWQLARDRVSDLYTKLYGRFRPLFFEVGDRLTRRGVLATPEDVLFLNWQEAVDALLHPNGNRDRIGDVDERRREMELAAELAMPETIFGREFMASTLATDIDDALVGVAVSRGVATGRAVVAASVSEAAEVTPDDVLVVPFSDVAWTGVLRRAGGIVAESGGLLSHSSIIAREASIPCVVSVPGAMSITPGSMVTVDGYRGTVSVERAS